MDQMGGSAQTLDAAALTPLARKASGHENLHLEGWHVEVLSGGAEQGSSIQRISGVGDSHGQSVPWSLVLKTITSSPKNSASLQASHYWTREANFYRSGLLADLPGGLRAPRCYACVEGPGSFQLFLEDLKDVESGMSWPVETYRAVARQLGQFNGAYLAGRPIPAAEWIPRHWLGSFLEEAAPNIDRFFRSLRNPILKRAFRTIPSKLIRQAWDRRQAILDALDQLPQAFCHQDAFCRNLFSEVAPDGRTLIAIDWSYAGPAPLGAELVALVCAGMLLGTIPFTEGNRLTQVTLEGYLEGLADVGWHGNPDLIRFAFSAGCFYRYPIGAEIGEFLEWIINEAYYPGIEQDFGMPIEQVADYQAVANAWIYPHYAEAMRLKKALKL